MDHINDRSISTRVIHQICEFQGVGVNLVGFGSDENDLQQATMARASLDKPLSIPNLARKALSRMTNDVLRFVGQNRVLGDVLDIRIIPTEDDPPPFYYMQKSTGIKLNLECENHPDVPFRRIDRGIVQFSVDLGVGEVQETHSRH